MFKVELYMNVKEFSHRISFFLYILAIEQDMNNSGGARDLPSTPLIKNQ